MNKQGIYAGFVKRGAAFLIDTIVFILINTLIASGFMAVIEFILKGVDVNSFNSIGIISMGSLFFVFILYFTLGESSSWQGTLGKKITKIIVVDQKGKKLTFSKALARSFTKFFSVLFLFGYLFVFFNNKKQALHDYLSNTTVINANNQA
ncbi:MAG: RDD family protein [Carboxydocellales bacterium]